MIDKDNILIYLYFLTNPVSPMQSRWNDRKPDIYPLNMTKAFRTELHMGIIEVKGKVFMM
jgi:hypothetical protein